MKLDKNIINGAADYRYLLNKGYPGKSALKLVGDRYRLSREGRSILFRGIMADEQALQRKKRVLQEADLAEDIFHIDGLNQIFTVGSYLKGKILYLAMDGMLRDAAELHAARFRKELLMRSLQLIHRYLMTLPVSAVCFYFDEISNSTNELTKLTESIFRRTNHTVFTTDQTDRDLSGLQSGIIASSDSQVIDRSSRPVFDLARHTLDFHFQPELPGLEMIGI